MVLLLGDEGVRCRVEQGTVRRNNVERVTHQEEHLVGPENRREVSVHAAVALGDPDVVLVAVGLPSQPAGLKVQCELETDIATSDDACDEFDEASQEGVARAGI